MRILGVAPDTVVSGSGVLSVHRTRQANHNQRTEHSDTPGAVQIDGEAHNRSSVASCYAPLYNWDHLYSSFQQNAEYKLLAGVKHLFFYVQDGNDPSLGDGLPLLAPYVNDGKATVVRFPQNLTSYFPPMQFERFTLTNCLWRAKAGEYDWALMQHDSDEYIMQSPTEVVTNPTTYHHNLWNLLNAVKKQDKIAALFVRLCQKLVPM